MTQHTILLICEQAIAKITNVTKAVTEAKLASINCEPYEARPSMNAPANNTKAVFMTAFCVIRDMTED